MTPAVTVGLIAAAGGAVVFLLLSWCLRNFSRRQDVRNLASALVGEIVALLRTIETNEVMAKLERAADSAEDQQSIVELALPRFVVYEADANKLDKFRAPMPRKIAYFYTRLTALRSDLANLHSGPFSGISGKNRRDQILSTLSELKDTLDLADDILRGLRPLISRPLSIYRRFAISHPDRAVHTRST